jgi:cysteinyl-tRNA synthetase
LLRGRPRRNKEVNIFVCGPTTYDLSHIGHARTYIVFDVIVKYLRQKGHDVFYLQNITDVDDKIIDKAKREKVFWRDLARKYEKEYLKDMKALKVNSVTKYARATEHIKEIINQVKKLLKKGYAYQIKDGIYYDISKFKDYGKLSRRTVLQAEDAISRIDESIEKRNRGDFCLWKYAKSLSSPTARSMRKGTCEYEPSWLSPFGPGRPGWHIEDTAITEKYFGPKYDIHGGAIELSFPHHEAEIAQMEAISGKKPLVKYWLHTGLLTIGGVKMSKSFGNFITIKDFLKKHSASPHVKDFGVGARILRFFVFKTHYRSPIDYNEKEIEQVKKQLERIDEFVNKIQNAKFKNQNYNAKFKITKYEKEFKRAMEDDFNTPKAVASIFNLVNKGNSLIARNKLTPVDARDILKLLRKIDKVFNFIFLKGVAGGWRSKIPSFIKKMVREREEAREKRDWKLADEIRRKIKDLGYQIEDTKEGPKIKTL